MVAITEFKKRVELHLHTKYSPDDSEADVGAYLKKAAGDGQTAMAVTDFMSVGAFSEAASKKPEGLRLLFGLEFFMSDGGHAFHTTALAKNERGIHALASLSRGGAVYKSALFKLKDGLLIGSACDEGELYQGLLCGKTEWELKNMASFYDYIEVQPPDNFAFLIEQGRVSDKTALTVNIKKLVRLGAFTGVPVVAVGDVCFLDKGDVCKREVLLKVKGVSGAYARAPLYFRTTAEMLREFDFLGRDAAWEITVENPNRLASLCEKRLAAEGFA